MNTRAPTLLIANVLLLANAGLPGCAAPTASLAPPPEPASPGVADERLAEQMRDARAKEIDWWAKYCEPAAAPGFICLQGREQPEKPKGNRYRAEYRSAASRKVGGRWTTQHRLVLELAP